MSNAVPQCTHTKTNGEVCGSPALRNQPYCHHHSGNHQVYTLDRIEEISALESITSTFLQQNQELAPLLHPNLNQTENLRATALPSIT
jgi:hypothetical protein